MVAVIQRSCLKGPIQVLILVFLLTGKSFASWLWLGVASVGTVSSPQEAEEMVCSVVPGLVTAQKTVCIKKPQTIVSVSEGARLGITECQKQFQRERWNCSTTDDDSVFGKILEQGNRETAFIYSVTTAGVVYAVTRACSAGNLTDCTCDREHGETHEEGWNWRGCSDNIHYAIGFSKTFVDAPDKAFKGDLLRSLMNLHNNEVGRKAIEEQMDIQCRCHGVSGSCNVKSCWKTMPHFPNVGDYLKTRYESSVELHPRAKKRLRRKDRKNRKVPINTTEMVYMDQSPNYCMEDTLNGVPGTSGRECNRTSLLADSCDLLCCGRGYNTQVVRYVERCGCKFIWCCYVKCNTCETMIDRYTCK